MRPIYVPIADSFFESSIMREALPVRFVMLALIRLALRAGANGVVDVDPLIFAQSINIAPDLVDGAVKRLMEPDPFSSAPDEDGRRIVPVNPERPQRGWRLVNWEKYRGLVHKANDAVRKREEYHAKKDSPDISQSLQKPPRASRILEKLSTNTNTNTNTSKKKREEKTPPTPSRGLPVPEDLLRVWNENRGEMLPAKEINGPRRTHAKSRLREEPDLERWAKAIQCASRSRFCLGGGERGWKANFDWLLKPDTLTKIEEGQFDETESYPSRAEVSDFFKVHVGLNRDAGRKRFREYFGLEYRPDRLSAVDGGPNLPSSGRSAGPPGPNDDEPGPDGGEA